MNGRSGSTQQIAGLLVPVRLPLLACLPVFLLAACGGGGGGGNPAGPAAPVISLTAAPTPVAAGSNATLRWTASRSTGCEAAGGWTGTRPVSGTEVVGPVRSDTRFELTCTGAGGSRTASLLLPVSAPASGISGRLLLGSTTQVDGDTNDPDSIRIPNNSRAEAQLLPNPVIVGGYVALPGRGPDGALQPAGDPVDYYRVSFTSSQTIELVIATDDPLADDLDLFLEDENGTLIDASLSTGRVERISVPAPGTYYVAVEAYSFASRGAAAYRLSIGKNLPNVAGNEPGLRLSDAFVPGEMLVRLKDGAPAGPGARVGTLGAGDALELGQRHGLTRLAGAASRELLYRLGDGTGSAASGRASIRALSPADPAAKARRFRSAEQRRKFDTLLALKAVRQDAVVRWAEPNRVLKATLLPNDPRYPQQRWHYERLQLPAAWDITRGDPGVIVAVLDTGVRMSHPDLLPNLIPGKDFVRGDNAGDGDGIDDSPDDPGVSGPGGSLTFHGTHVAGTVSAAGNNGTGGAGVSWNTRIMPVRVLGNDGSGTLADILQGIRWAAGLPNDAGQSPATPAHIINLSLGALRSCSAAESEVISAARAAGVIVVASAGNDGTNLPAAPAACPGVVSVAAINSAGSRAFYSNFGAWVRVAAPGGDGTDRDGDGLPDAILSTHAAAQGGGNIVNTYDYLIGTSMAAPHVAGVFALMKALNPSLTPAQLDDLLAAGLLTQDIGPPGPDELGVGLIDAFRAVQADTSTPPPPVPVLSVVPRALNFGDVGTEAEVLVSNVGSGAITITQLFKLSSWLSVAPLQVGPTGLGTYRLQISRVGLSPGTYSGFVDFVSTAGTERLQVLMQVVSSPVVPRGGRQYVLLVDPATDEVVRQQALDVVGPATTYALSSVPPGSYVLVVGSDLNNNGVICDDGEACGAYPVYAEPGTVRPGTADLDFETAFRTYGALSGASAGSPAAKRAYPVRPD